MNIRISELLDTPDFQFLRIYKNGNLSVMKCVLDKYKKEDIKNNQTLINNKPRWTVIRDPYDRFVSGLKYDLKRNKLSVEDIDIKKIFTPNENNVLNRARGYVNHSASQVAAMMDWQIGYYVDITDLDVFLKMHFGKSCRENENKDKIELNLDKQEIMKYLSLDYYVYNVIKNSPFFWEWQHGKIF